MLMNDETDGIDMEFRVLGPLEVVRSGVSIDLGPHRQRALLALLVINANRVVTTDRIIEEFWRDDPDGKERTLWVYISRLRSILEPDREKRGDNAVLGRRSASREQLRKKFELIQSSVTIKKERVVQGAPKWE